MLFIAIITLYHCAIFVCCSPTIQLSTIVTNPKILNKSTEAIQWDPFIAVVLIIEAIVTGTAFGFVILCCCCGSCSIAISNRAREETDPKSKNVEQKLRKETPIKSSQANFLGSCSPLNQKHPPPPSKSRLSGSSFQHCIAICPAGSMKKQQQKSQASVGTKVTNTIGKSRAAKIEKK